ncbi:hypothetical protein Mtc_2196 [Methanocella conradii HZ254]|uniref:Uncharacterized protein n=1 Tax=Methanocella conradii (strain DSM 24694 / JCM 17849 / CGMCC 1.5162 / HZ254) TaxID=1041930 RepID=H8I9X1_METCZ|nr:hypothetical protein [Methanocella conradii]AFD00931.1 hypothetical protein Mtc_2196 [Methanocella conradii HZ254]MDI6897605.1 hypothetical protein [Methanocella conradii]
MAIRLSRGRALKIAALALLIPIAALAILSTEAFARTEARYLMRVGDDAIFGNDLYNSRSIQTLFHQQTLDTSDVESYDASFSGALPFGQVSLALPSISEESSQEMSASSVGFFQANYNYRPETVLGNVPLSPDYPEAVQQAIRPASMLGWSQLYPEQYGAIAIRNKLKEMNKSTPKASTAGANAKAAYSMDLFKPKNASSGPQDEPVIYPWYFDMIDKTQTVFPNPGYGSCSTNGAGSVGAARMTTNNKAAGNQSKSASNSLKPINTTSSGLTYADFSFDATTEQINNMSIVERMWRNSHRGGMMGKAYAGDTSAPLWIDPYERPYVMPRIDEHYYCMQSALNMTQPGTQIMPRFWTLMF